MAAVSREDVRLGAVGRAVDPLQLVAELRERFRGDERVEIDACAAGRAAFGASGLGTTDRRLEGKDSAAPPKPRRGAVASGRVIVMGTGPPDR